MQLISKLWLKLGLRDFGRKIVIDSSLPSLRPCVLLQILTGCNLEVDRKYTGSKSEVIIFIIPEVKIYIPEVKLNYRK